MVARAALRLIVRPVDIPYALMEFAAVVRTIRNAIRRISQLQFATAPQVTVYRAPTVCNVPLTLSGQCVSMANVKTVCPTRRNVTIAVISFPFVLLMAPVFSA